MGRELFVPARTLIGVFLLMAHEQSNARCLISAVLLFCQELMQVLHNVTVEICQLKAACDRCSMKLPL